MVSHQLLVCNSSDNAIHFCSYLGLSMSKTWIDYVASGAVVEKIRNCISGGVKGKRYDFLEIVYNNLGVKEGRVTCS